MSKDLLITELAKPEYDGMDSRGKADAINAKTAAMDAGEIDPFQIDNAVPIAEREALRVTSPAFYDKWQAVLASGRGTDVKSAVMQGALADLGPGGAQVFSQGTVDAINALGTIIVPLSFVLGYGQAIKVRDIEAVQ